MDDFEDIVSRLPELAEIEIPSDSPSAMYLTIEWIEEEDSFKIVATNCDSQDEVVWMLTGMLTEFAVGTTDFCPELDVEVVEDDED